MNSLELPLYQYQENQRYFAQIAGGLEEEGAQEITALGAKKVARVYRGLYFNASRAALYRINYQSRLITRVLAPLIEFDCHSDRYLYKMGREVDWRKLMGPKNTFAVFATVSQSKITHSKFASLRLKDAIVDKFRDETGHRPSIDRRNPDVWLNLHIHQNKAVISLDTSGGSLHRRGYRKEAVKAPMQETVAAAAVRMSGWDGTSPLYDPFCGSGTLLCEALMHYAQVPAGYLRPVFGFQRMPDFKQMAWEQVKEEADKAIKPVPQGLFNGSDRDREAISFARINCNGLPGGKQIACEVSDFQNVTIPEGSTIICNPPYGLRIGQADDMSALYKSIGDFFKQKCKGSTAYVYFGNREWIKHLGLRTTWKKPLVNGQLDGRLVKYEMY